MSYSASSALSQILAKADSESLDAARVETIDQ